MILEKSVKLKTKGLKKKEYYENLSYNLDNEFIIVKIEDLYKGSSALINAKCDYCNEIKECKYQIYNRSLLTSNKYACSPICSKKKLKDFIILKYGVDNISKLDLIKEKKKETCIKNWGVGCNFKSNITKDKKKDTYLKNWGVYNPSKSDMIKKRKEKTTINTKIIQER
jgi:hypothetical protein